MQPEEGFSKVFAVPRLRKCISRLMVHLVNQFGNGGGYLSLLTLLQTHSSLEDKMDFNIVAALANIGSLPFLLFQKDFISDFGSKFVDACICCLRNEKAKEMKSESLNFILTALDRIY
jgi:hypothetical protein